MKIRDRINAYFDDHDVVGIVAFSAAIIGTVAGVSYLNSKTRYVDAQTAQLEQNTESTKLTDSLWRETQNAERDYWIEKREVAEMDNLEKQERLEALEVRK